MKRLLNEVSEFREEMIAGYTAAYGRFLRRVPDASGVMANGAPAPGRWVIGVPARHRDLF